jgi:hypothetical protein
MPAAPGCTAVIGKSLVAPLAPRMLRIGTRNSLFRIVPHCSALLISAGFAGFVGFFADSCIPPAPIYKDLQ